MPTSAARNVATVPNDLESYWMPFTPNRAFKKAPRLIARAKDMHYYTPEGRAILDGTAGLWCTNAGHNRAPIVRAIQDQAAELDYAPAFQFSHPKAFELAARIAALAPEGPRPRLLLQFGLGGGRHRAEDRARLSQRARQRRAHAPDRPRARLSRRRLRRHLGRRHRRRTASISARMLAGVDHLPHTYNREQQAFTKGEPEWGAHLADDLERIVALHDASTIAAVIVEPMAGSTGVLPAPKGYLQRLRAICDKYGILLIFDEVITGFGRLGHAVCRRALWRDARPHDLRQGRDLGLGADGRRRRAQGHLRGLHAGARARRRAVPRLHLLGASARLRGGARHPRSLPRGEGCSSGQRRSSRNGPTR